MMIVKLNIWRPSIEFLSEDVLKPIRYKVRKNIKVLDFVEEINSLYFKIPIENIRVMKRNALFHMAEVEVINQEKNLDRTLMQIRVN